MDLEFQQLYRKLDQIRQEQVESGSTNVERFDWKYENSINAYNDQIQAIDFRTNQALAAQSDYFRSRVENLQSEVWLQTSSQLEEQAALIEESISTEYAYQQARINQLQDTLAEIQQAASHHLEIAWQTFYAAQNLFNSIQICYNLEPLWQKEMGRFLYQLEQSQINLEYGFDEAALVGTQQILQRLTELNHNLDQYTHLRQDAILSAQELANEVIGIIHQNQRVQAVDLQGVLLPATLEVDFWSGGQLRPLFRLARGILHQLNAPAFTLEIDQINDLRERLESINEEIPDIVLNARIQVLSSQLRFSIAECVLEALRTQGYELCFGGFMGSDMRNPYQLNLGNLAGSHVFVKVSQIPDQPLAQNLDFETNDHEAISDYEIRQRHNELETALSLFGLNVGLIQGPDSVFSQAMKSQPTKSASGWLQTHSLKPAKIELHTQ